MSDKVAENGTVLDDDTKVSVPAASASAADQVPQPTRPSENPLPPDKGQPTPEDAAPVVTEDAMPAATETVNTQSNDAVGEDTAAKVEAAAEEGIITDSNGDPVDVPASKVVKNAANENITQVGLDTPNDVRREIRGDTVVEYYPQNEESVPSDVPQEEVNQGPEPVAQVVREPEAREELMQARREGNPEAAPLSQNQSEEVPAEDAQGEEYQGTVTEPTDPNAYQATFTPEDDDGIPFEKRGA